MLAIAGTAGGLLLGRWLIALAPALLPPSGLAVDYRIALDARVLAVTLAAGVLAALTSGLLPTVGALRADLLSALRPTASDARRTGRLRTGLVILQVALAVAVVDTASVLIGSFVSVRDQWPGFDATKPLHVLELSVGDAAGPPANWTGVLDAIRVRAAALPGVRHATFVRRIPMSGSGGGATTPVEAADAGGGGARRA